MDPTKIMKEKAPSMAKARKKRRNGKKGYDQLSAGNPKHHLVHVHVNVVNSAGSEDKKRGPWNIADNALRNLRGH